jgi:RNA polymerase sigma-70 factor (sigma-E family)
MHTDPPPSPPAPTRVFRLLSAGPAAPPRDGSQPADAGAAGAGPADPGQAGPGPAESGQAESGQAAVTALYQAHALGLVRLAHVMLGDRSSAEDIVQDAFCGLYRRWGALSDEAKALQYVRSCVLNGCRTQLRHRRRGQIVDHLPSAVSAETSALTGEEHREVMTALRGLPHRQREVLVLRFFLDLTEAQIAADMGIGQSTVRSTTHRALAALGRKLKETS